MTDWKTSLFGKVDRAHRRLNNAVKDRWPILSVWLYQRPRARFLLYKLEKALLRGVEVNTVDRPSIVFFTTHKAASMFMDRLLRRLSTAHGMLPTDIEAWFSTGSPKLWSIFKDPRAMQRLFRPKGLYYGALRAYREIPDLDTYRVVVALRDPRDMLTSYYYSEAFSHAPINKRVLERRVRAQAQTIDEFVLEHAPRHYQVYKEYIDKLHGRPHVHFTTYERMTADLEGWFRDVVEHVGLTERPDLVAELLEEARKVKGSGRKESHVRVARPGDHRDKLLPATVAELDRLFAPVMSVLYPAEEDRSGMRARPMGRP